MKFGIREVCDVTLTRQSGNGPSKFEIDTAKMTTLEGASTTVYAQGGRGNSRLMAWEGEKTLTFTIEDALITLDSFHALTGTEIEIQEEKTTFVSKTTSFAGYYEITAETFFRDENGEDHVATISIPRAKLQTQLNLSLASSGDPSTFTFTFDAFPVDNVLFKIEINALYDSNTKTSFKLLDGRDETIGATLAETEFTGLGILEWGESAEWGIDQLILNDNVIFTVAGGVDFKIDGFSEGIINSDGEEIILPLSQIRKKTLPSNPEGYIYYFI